MSVDWFSIIYCFLRFDMMELDRSSRFTHDGTVSREPLSADKDAATAVADEVPAENLDAARIPLRLKIIAVLLVSSIGFGSHWSSGVTSAMKSTLKKELDIDNTKYAALTASSDFMTTVLILFTGSLTDRIGGAGAMLWGNVVFSLGSILIAAATTVRSYRFMIGATIIQSFGDIATQVAQYKIFSSWFAPSNGFAATLGLELGLGKIGSFVGQATANIIAKKTGDFSWVYWCAVFMNLFTNAATLVFFLFRKWCDKHYRGTADPATGEILTEKNARLDVKKMMSLPLAFWGVILFSLFQTSTAIVYSQNATELAEQRFDVDAITAGWYSAASEYLGFVFVPCIGVFIDVYGHRLTLMSICGIGVFVAMVLCAFGPSVGGTAASFGVYAVAYTFGPTVIIDGIRTAIWSQEVFGFGYAVKICVNNSMNIIVRIVTGVIQDRDDNSYDHVVIVYVILASGAVMVALGMVGMSFRKMDVGKLQLTRKQRLRRGSELAARKEELEIGGAASWVPFGGLAVLVLGAWAAYFWGVATGNNS